MEFDFSNILLFEGVSKKDLAEITGRFKPPKRYEKGEYIFTHSEFSNSLGIVLSGEAKINVPAQKVTRVVLKRLYAGDIFGAASLFEEKEYVSDIIAVSPCTVLFIERDLLLSIFEQYPKISVNYIKMLTQRVRFLNERIKSLSGRDATAKLKEYLYNNARDDKSVPLPKSVNELAKVLGIGRSSLYRAIETLEKEGVILRKGKETYLL